jgi:hypothetical protein
MRVLAITALLVLLVGLLTVFLWAVRQARVGDDEVDVE